MRNCWPPRAIVYACQRCPSGQCRRQRQRGQHAAVRRRTRCQVPSAMNARLRRPLAGQQRQREQRQQRDREAGRPARPADPAGRGGAAEQLVGASASTMPITAPPPGRTGPAAPSRTAAGAPAPRTAAGCRESSPKIFSRGPEREHDEDQRRPRRAPRSVARRPGSARRHSITSGDHDEQQQRQAEERGLLGRVRRQVAVQPEPARPASGSGSCR